MIQRISAFLVILLCFTVTRNASASIFLPTQDTTDAIISGYVKDSLSGETIIGATIRVRSLKRGAITNKSGYFALHLPSETDLLLEISSLGYRTLSNKIRLSSDEKRSENRSYIGAIPFWGAQAASLPRPAACRAE